MESKLSQPAEIKRSLESLELPTDSREFIENALAEQRWKIAIHLGWGRADVALFLEEQLKDVDKSY